MTVLTCMKLGMDVAQNSVCKELLMVTLASATSEVNNLVG